MLLKYGCATLRAIEPKDCALLLNMMNDPEIEISTVGEHAPVSENQQNQWIAGYRNDDSNIRLMIELTNGKTIGMISLTSIDYKNGTAHTGFKIGCPLEDRMKHDTFDACAALYLYAFQYLRLNCIEGLTLEDNTFSLNLQKRLGFQVEGVLRERVFKDGEYRNLVSTSLLKREFLEKINK